MRRILGVLAIVALLTGCVKARQETFDDSEDSGIRGRVSLGPQCPVEQEGSPCSDVPTEAIIEIATVDGTSIVARQRSDVRGHFMIPLEPGEYLVTAVPLGEVGVVFGKPVTVRVPEGRFVEIDLSLDTGIR